MTREEIWNKAYTRIFELFGENPDLRIVNRFLSEKARLAHFGAAEYFEEIANIFSEAMDEYNEKLICKNIVSSCFSAYLLGASEINPLPTHYYCSSCKQIKWLNEDVCILDIQNTHLCNCGAEMRIDGFNIPFEIFIPYAEKLNEKTDISSVKTYKDLFEALTKKHFQHSLLEITQKCHLLGQRTGISANEIDLSDNTVKAKLFVGNFECVNSKLADFLQKAYTIAQPNNYNELLKLIGLAHGTGTWKNNGEDLLKNGKCRLAGIPVTRDEVFMLIRDAMREHGVYDTSFAYDIANKTRKGFYVENGMDGYTINTLKALGFDDWFASYLLGVRYMSTKALSVMELHYIILLTWYQTYYPKQYAEVIGEDIWEPH
jgi:DNA polymerase III alpha subunit (gram-positive type)